MTFNTDAAVHVPPMVAEGIEGVRLAHGGQPGRVVVVRLHAFGDAVITLPVLGALRTALPAAQITLVTSTHYAELFAAVACVDAVLPVATDGSRPARALAALRAGLALAAPDLLIDIQRSAQSGILRRASRARAWVAFDRFAPRTALDRYLDAARWVGLDALAPEYAVALRPEAAERAATLLAGVRLDEPYAVLNPAGCWATKNWPAERYAELGGMLWREYGLRPLLIGTEHIRPHVAPIRRELGELVVDLVGRTTAAEALALVAGARLVVSDDSGLMHMAWVAGAPTIGLFGASRSAWSRPCGPRAYVFASEDLPCGACMSPRCSRGDLLCLNRVTPAMVMEVARGWLNGRPARGPRRS